MRNKVYTFVRGYDKYAAMLKTKVEKLEAENQELRKWKLKHLAKVGKIAKESNNKTIE